MTDREIKDYTESTSDDALRLSIQMAVYRESLLAAGFKRPEVARLLAALLSRPVPNPPVDMAALNAVMQNMLEGLST